MNFHRYLLSWIISLSHKKSAVTYTVTNNFISAYDNLTTDEKSLKAKKDSRLKLSKYMQFQRFRIMWIKKFLIFLA